MCLTPPEFCANLVWELVKDDKNDLFVRTIYNGMPILSICAGKNTKNTNLGYCPYQEFVSFVKSEMVLEDKQIQGLCFYKSGDKIFYILLMVVFGVLSIFLIGMMVYSYSLIRSTNQKISDIGKEKELKTRSSK